MALVSGSSWLAAAHGRWYYTNMTDRPEPSQPDKFKEAARELECDDDDQRFKERVGKLVKHKPVEKPE